MYLVTIYDELDDSNKKHEFSSVTKANDFLYRAGGSFDSFQDGIHLWYLDEFRYGTIETIDK